MKWGKIMNNDKDTLYSQKCNIANRGIKMQQISIIKMPEKCVP